jgi:hypothetical protein
MLLNYVVAGAGTVKSAMLSISFQICGQAATVRTAAVHHQRYPEVKHDSVDLSTS